MSEAEWELDEEAQDATAAQMRKLEEIRADFITTFSTPAGEKTLLSLYDFCRQMSTTFIHPESDPHGRQMTFLEGRRSVILKIMEHLQMDDVEIIERARRFAQTRLERA